MIKTTRSVFVNAFMSLMAGAIFAPARPLPQDKTKYYEDEKGRTRIDHRATERNKYAPWGRGYAV